MKTPNDHKTMELPTFAVGNPPCFDLDETAPWPKPAPVDGKPQAEQMAEKLKNWAMRVMETRL